MPRKHLCLADLLWLTEMPMDCVVFPVPCWFLGSWMQMDTVLYPAAPAVPGVIAQWDMWALVPGTLGHLESKSATESV